MEQLQIPTQALGLDDLLSRQAAATDAKIQKALAGVDAQITRTDGKASALLAAFGIPLAVLVAAVPGHHLPVPAAILIGLGAAGLVAAMLVVLLVVRPNIKGAAKGSYLYWKDCTPEEVLADLSVDRTAESIVKLSTIAATKYRGLRIAIDITAGALVLLVLALGTALALS